MIVSSLGSAGLYLPLNERFAAAFDYIKNLDLISMDKGRYEIDGDKVYMMITDELNLKTVDAAKLEVHDKYIDIQIPLTAEEGFGWSQRSECQNVSIPMNLDKDIMYYSDIPSTYVKIHPGQFVVFFPSDAHAPMVGEGTIKKCIIKVLV